MGYQLNKKGCINMKTIVSLIALTCLLGLAGAQIMGEGYSSTQLAFFNAPSSI
jgi:hypothetical protein